MKKELVVSKVETPEADSNYVYVLLTDVKDNFVPTRRQQGFPENSFGIATIPITSLDDLKNLPKKISDAINAAFSGGSNSKSSHSTIFKMKEKEYRELGIKTGDRVTLEIKISDRNIVDMQ
ncbi:MAG TPA: hypothetical protein VE619_00225 [Nitrososphaeraceae archaeon]|nr:hypothetical protein [Nitrososphaeraceae archaeon]